MVGDLGILRLLIQVWNICPFKRRSRHFNCEPISNEIADELCKGLQYMYTDALGCMMPMAILLNTHCSTMGHVHTTTTSVVPVVAQVRFSVWLQSST